jgi:hypothetical protein
MTQSDAPQSVGLLWTSDHLVAETSTWQQHTTLTRNRHPCPRWDSNPQSQQANGRRPTLEQSYKRNIGISGSHRAGIVGCNAVSLGQRCLRRFERSQCLRLQGRTFQVKFDCLSVEDDMFLRNVDKHLRKDTMSHPITSVMHSNFSVRTLTSRSWLRASSMTTLNKNQADALSFKIIKFYFTLRCSTCFGHHCVHHQELPTTAHAASGHRVV